MHVPVSRTVLNFGFFTSKLTTLFGGETLSTLGHFILGQSLKSIMNTCIPCGLEIYRVSKLSIEVIHRIFVLLDMYMTL